MSLPKKLQKEVDVIKKDFDENKPQETLDKIKKLFGGKFSNRTISTRYSLIKKEFKEITKNKDFLNKIKPLEEITKNLIEKNKTIRDNKKMFNVSKEIIEKILNLKNSVNPYDLAIFLLFVSGRRSNEILNSKFLNEKKNKLIKMEGISKRTDINNFEFIPLVNKTSFFKIYKKFKKFNLNKDTFPRLLSLRIKKMLGNEFHPHMLRGIYASYLFKFKNPKELKINTFIQHVLGHSSIDSSLSYTGYDIVFDKPIKM